MPARGSIAGAYADVARNRSLRHTLLAFLVFSAQEYAVWIAVTLYAFARGGAGTAGAVAALQLVPAAIVAPLAAALGDRMRRDRALSLGYSAQAVASVALGVALWRAPAGVAYAMAVVSACTMTLTRPVHNAILPQLADTPEQLTASNSVTGAVEGFGYFLGPLLNSVLVVVGGPALVCVVIGALMSVAALLTSGLRLRPAGAPQADVPSDSEEAPTPASLRAVLHDVGEGVNVLRHDRPAAAITLFTGAQFLVLGMLDIFYAVLAIDVLGIGEQGAGLLAAAVGIGGLAGATATATLVGRRRLASPIEVAIGVMAGATAAVSLTALFGPTLLLLVIAGAGRSFFDVAARTLLQRSVRDEILVRVFGLQEALLMGGFAVGAALAPVLLGVFGEQGAFVAVGVLIVGTGVAVLPFLRALDRRAVVPDAERLALLGSIQMFAVLSQPRLENIVARLKPVHVDAGRNVITRGEVGDRFFIVAQGEAAVLVDGRELTRHTRGGYVGEIALLRDIPRTADVRAETDLELYALDRDDFLFAVTGSRRGVRIADSEVDRRLAQLDALEED